MQRSETIGTLVAALAKAQGEFTPALKETKNDFFNSKYADLAANISAVRPALSKHGIALIQFDASDLERQVGIVTTALHCGEEWISITAEAPAVGQKGFNVQSLGACWTYLRRYTLQAICGLASEDDDGNSIATDNKPIPKRAKDAVAQAEPLSEETVRERLKIIEEAPDLESLSSAYKDAYRVAQLASDDSALNLFTAAKDGRKKALNANR